MLRTEVLHKEMYRSNHVAILICDVPLGNDYERRIKSKLYFKEFWVGIYGCFLVIERFYVDVRNKSLFEGASMRISRFSTTLDKWNQSSMGHVYRTIEKLDCKLKHIRSKESNEINMSEVLRTKRYFNSFSKLDEAI